MSELCWKVKETTASEADLPQWGSAEERGIAWEAETATALIIAGAELLIMRHPKAVATVEKLIEELIKGSGQDQGEECLTLDP
jgi:acetyl-CoA decarbonylase/synthase complex subunit delta